MATVELFFDIGSPYSYLAATQIEKVADRQGADVRWRPFLLGGVFKATGNEMPARIPAKASFMLRDLHRWAKQYGVPFAFPPIFPVNALRAMRACAAAEARGKAREVALSLFEAYWVRGRDPSSEEAIREAAEAAGLDGAELYADTERPEVKDRLRANTEEAVARGAFGAPTLFVGDELFWGNDRLEHVEAALQSAREGGA